jgi:hypothetical protein
MTAEIAERSSYQSLSEHRKQASNVQLWLVGENKNPVLSEASPCHVLLDISKISDYQMLADG